MNWWEARKWCLSRGMQLGSLENEEKEQEIALYLNSQRKSTFYASFGAITTTLQNAWKQQFFNTSNGKKLNKKQEFLKYHKILTLTNI